MRAALLCLALLMGDAARADEAVGGAIEQPLDGLIGDSARGRAIVANRQQGLCLLCHSGPIPEERFQGNLAPSLAGAGSRWSAGQLRLRLVEGQAGGIMPAYYLSKDRSTGLQQVGRDWQGKTIFSPQQVEDVLAYLLTLRD